MDVVLRSLTLAMAQSFDVDCSHRELPADTAMLTMAYARAAIIPNAQIQAIVERETEVCVGIIVSGCSVDDGKWWLYDLVIASRYLRRGYGRAAIAQLISQLEHLVFVDYLYTAYPASDATAQAFLVALGWVLQSDAVDGVTVALALSPQVDRAATIQLQPITRANARACLALTVAPHQTRFVADTAISLVQSMFEPHWITQGIYADDTMVGFVMYGYDPDYGWGIVRLLVDFRFQGRGYGRQAINLVLLAIQAAGGTSVGVSYEAENEVARRLYQTCGFVETAEQPFGEPFAVATLEAS